MWSTDSRGRRRCDLVAMAMKLVQRAESKQAESEEVLQVVLDCLVRDELDKVFGLAKNSGSGGRVDHVVLHALGTDI